MGRNTILRDSSPFFPVDGRIESKLQHDGHIRLHTYVVTTKKMITDRSVATSGIESKADLDIANWLANAEDAMIWKVNSEIGSFVEDSNGGLRC